MAKIPSYLLNLAGEYRVCSELNKRGVFATVTYGNHKAVDVYAINDHKDRAVKIEVKTSQQGNFVTRLGPKRDDDNGHSPDFWVLFQIRPVEDGTFGERFFVLTHKEIVRAQTARNKLYAAKYFARNKRQFDFSGGVDSVRIEDVEPFEDQWSKIIKRLNGPRA
jgi:hypothetical protein